MKYLLIFLILTSCGKHTAPAEKDLRDSDGDGSSNEYDSDKFKADVVTMEKINAVLEFETGRNIIVKHTFNLGNNIDLQEFSKDLMVKKSSSTTDDDFFSEFSVLKIREKNLVPVILEKTIQIDTIIIVTIIL